LHYLSDTLSITYTEETNSKSLKLINVGIAWTTDKQKLFRNPPGTDTIWNLIKFSIGTACKCLVRTILWASLHYLSFCVLAWCL